MPPTTQNNRDGPGQPADIRYRYWPKPNQVTKISQVDLTQINQQGRRYNLRQKFFPMTNILEIIKETNQQQHRQPAKIPPQSL